MDDKLFKDVKVGDQVLRESGYSYDRTLNLKIGTVKSVSKTRFKVSFKRKDDEYVQEFYLSGEAFGKGPYYVDHVKPLTKEARERFNAWKARVIAERDIRDAGDKLNEAYRDNVRDDRDQKISTEDLCRAAAAINQAIDILTPNKGTKS